MTSGSRVRCGECSHARTAAPQRGIRVATSPACDETRPPNDCLVLLCVRARGPVGRVWRGRNDEPSDDRRHDVGQAGCCAGDVPSARRETAIPTTPARTPKGSSWAGDGELFESTGRRGESTLRRVDDRDRRSYNRTTTSDPEYFGEGLAQVIDELIQLTWQEEHRVRLRRLVVRREGHVRVRDRRVGSLLRR